MMQMDGVAMRTEVCANCRMPVTSRSILVVYKTSRGIHRGDDMRLEGEMASQRNLTVTHFHPHCLFCSRCGLQMDESNGHCWTNRLHGVLCPNCHRILTNCFRCKRSISFDSWVHRIYEFSFHISCFTCNKCDCQLNFGECIGFTEGKLFCSKHFQTTISSLRQDEYLSDGMSIQEPFLSNLQKTPPVNMQTEFDFINCPNMMNCHSRRSSIQSSYPQEEKQNLKSIKSYSSPPASPPFSCHKEGKEGTEEDPKRAFESQSFVIIESGGHRSKRIRTSFTPQQIGILQASFESEANPDGQELERIAHAACLNKRVTQVWFQNARARKKKTTRGGDSFDSSVPMGLSDRCHFPLSSPNDDGSCGEMTVCFSDRESAPNFHYNLDEETKVSNMNRN